MIETQLAQIAAEALSLKPVSNLIDALLTDVTQQGEQAARN